MTAGFRLEEVPCPLCDSSEYRVVLTAKDLNFGVPGTFTIVQCRQCKMQFLSPRPRPEDLRKVYPALYAWGYQRATAARHVAALRRCLSFVKRAQPMGRLLEVGCAAGHFLRLAQVAGYHVAGVEMDVRTAQHARENFGFDVMVTSIESAALAPGQYDIVCLFDVFEHTLNPKLALDVIRGGLTPDGVVVIKVPNFGCWESRLWGGYWYGKDLPRDLLHFTPQTLSEMLRRGGFRRIEIHQVGEPNYAVQSLIKWTSALLGRQSGNAGATATGGTPHETPRRKIQEAETT